MRAALFTKEFPPHIYGGAGVHVDYLSRELARKIDVEVHCWGKQHADLGRLHVRGAEPWDEITHGTTGKFKGALEALSLNLTQVKALEGIDICHTHTWYVSMAGFLAKKLYNVPFVLTTHSLEPLRAWKSEQLGSGYAMSSWMERTAILEADAIIAVSHGTKADVLRAYDVPADRVHVIYNGIDLNEYQQTADTTALRQYGVDPAVPYVLFVGRITRAETIQLYSHARVFCCPSVYEPFGIINLEAMACRAPVVASATGGILEVVVDGETGYLVPFQQDRVTGFPIDPDQFARDLGAKLTTLLQDPVACKRFGEAGRKRVEQHFAWTSIADQTIALYQELIARRK